MAELIIALVVFLTAHCVAAAARLRSKLIERIGFASYLALYSAFSAITLAWVIIAALKAPVELLWSPTGWQAWVTIATSPIALFLIVAGAVSNNPLSLSAFTQPRKRPDAIVSVTRHPVFWGALIWAAGHIVPNGQTRSVLMFGTLSILAAAGFWLGDKRARRRLGEEQWSQIAQNTSVMPFAAILKGRASLSIDRAMILALIVTALTTGWLLYGGHAVLFGSDPLAATHY